MEEEDTSPSKGRARRSRSAGGGSDKVTQNQFSPQALRVANHSKELVRERIALICAFPGTGEKKEAFVWDAVKTAAKNLKLMDVLTQAQSNDRLKEQLITYVRPSCMFWRSLIW